MAWFLLIGAGLLEVVWATALAGSPFRLVCLALIVLGVVGLKLA